MELVKYKLYSIGKLLIDSGYTSVLVDNSKEFDKLFDPFLIREMDFLEYSKMSKGKKIQYLLSFDYNNQSEVINLLKFIVDIVDNRKSILEENNKLAKEIIGDLKKQTDEVIREISNIKSPSVIIDSGWQAKIETCEYNPNMVCKIMFLSEETSKEKIKRFVNEYNIMKKHQNPNYIVPVSNFINEEKKKLYKCHYVVHLMNFKNLILMIKNTQNI